MKNVIIFAILAFLVGVALRQYVQIRQMNENMIRLASVVEADHRMYTHLIRVAANPPWLDSQIQALEGKGIKVMVQRPIGGEGAVRAVKPPQKAEKRTQQ